MSTICYRIIDALHREDVLRGRSAALSGGRWNPRGQEAVYGSQTISLAVLEMLCHYGRGCLTADLVVATIAVPDSLILRIEESHLAARWMVMETYTQQIGASLMTSNVMGLDVPSTVHRYERNLVLNPRHDDFVHVKVLALDALALDHRVHTSDPNRS